MNFDRYINTRLAGEHVEPVASKSNLVDETCATCGEAFQRSVYATNQKWCCKCSHARKNKRNAAYLRKWRASKKAAR